MWISTATIWFASCSREVEAWLTSYTVIVDHAQSLIFALLANVKIASEWYARSSRDVVAWLTGCAMIMGSSLSLIYARFTNFSPLEV